MIYILLISEQIKNSKKASMTNYEKYYYLRILTLIINMLYIFTNFLTDKEF